MRQVGKKGWIGLGAVIALTAVSAAAYGYFTATGEGSASSTVGETEPVAFEAVTPTEYLYPGTTADVAVKITNPNVSQVFVPSLVLDLGEGEGGSGFAVDGGHSGCDVAALSFTTQDNSGDGWYVPGADDPPAELVLHLDDAITMDTSAANACQGATFTVYLAVGT
jgi:hypothetical protein